MHQARSLMMMEHGLSGLFHFLLLSRSVSGLGSVVGKHYGYHGSANTWQSAKAICRSSTYYIDLATIYTESVTDHWNMKAYSAWIGLHKPDSSSDDWSWIGGQDEDVDSWAHNEPDSGEDCAIVNSNNKKFYGTHCGGYYFFICHEIKRDKFHYTFVPQSKTWSEAQQYCENHFHDLATFKDSSAVENAVGDEDFPVWIGLHRDGEVWRWSTGLSEYRDWAGNEPGNSGSCVAISSLGKKMSVRDCSARYPYVCFRDNLVLVKENKTWEEALEYCRAFQSSPYHYIRYELLSVQPGDDHHYVMEKVREADTEKVWAGLRFLANEWLWVNKATMSYSDLPSCPQGRQHCGALSKEDTEKMKTTDCLEKLNFLCYRAA